MKKILSIEKTNGKNNKVQNLKIDTQFLSVEELSNLNYSKHLEAKKIKQETKNNFSTFKFQISNDGYRNKIDGNNDTGHTFGIQSELKFKVENNSYKLNMGLDEYTSGEKFYYNPVTGKRVWNRTNFDNSSRIDRAYINLTPEVYNENISGINIKGYFGGGIDAIGNFGLGDVQKSVHDLTGRYSNKSKYEDINGISPTINGSLELDSIIYGNTTKGVSIYGNLDAQLALINKYGSNNISATVGIKAEYDGFGVDISRTEGFGSLPKASKTLIKTGLNGHISSTNVKLYAPLIKDLSIYFEYKKDNNPKYHSDNKIYMPNNQTVGGLEYKF